MAVADFVPRLLFFKTLDLKRGCVCVSVCLSIGGIGEVDGGKEITLNRSLIKNPTLQMSSLNKQTNTSLVK